MVLLNALKDFPIGRKRVGPGKPPFEIGQKEASLLVALKMAEYVTGVMVAEISPRTGRPKRQYKRRDMKAHE